MSERTIRVTGQGSLRSKPDYVNLNLRLEDIKKEHKDAAAAASEALAGLRNILAGLGFGADELKSKSFDIRAEFKSIRDEHDEWQEKLVGYRYVHVLRLGMPLDQERLGECLYALSSAEVRPQIELAYALSEPEAPAHQVLKKAVADALAKAEVLAAAAGLKLGSILKIDYSPEGARFGRSLMLNEDTVRMMSAASGGKEPFSFDVEPEEIESRDEVTLVLEIF